MDLDTAANIATSGAVIVAVVFGLTEIRRGAQDRRDRAAVEIVRSVQTHDTFDAVGQILNLPDDVDPRVIRADPGLLNAAMLVYFACEMFGAVVYEGVVELRTLDRMVGGWVRASWLRLRRWVESERVQDRNPNVGDRWQWLYEQLEEDPDPGKALGTHVGYRNKRRR
jgi:hypothetical protein